MAYFNPKYYRYGIGPKFESRIIANSQVITTGGLVNLVSGFIDGADAGERIFGLVMGIHGSLTTADGVPLDLLSSANDYDGTYVPGVIGTQKYTASADNQTDKKIEAQIDIAPDLVMSNEPDAAIGTTAGSELAGNFTDIVSDVQVDENNAAAAFTTIAQMIIFGLDPDNSAFGLYGFMEKQDWGG